MAAKKTVTAEPTAKKEIKAKTSKVTEEVNEIEATDESIEEAKVGADKPIEEIEVNTEKIKEVEKELEATKELIEEFSNPEEKLEKIIKENTKEPVTALQEELKRVESIEKKVTEEIKKTEAKLTTSQRNSIRDFWCGVSDGWNN